MVSINLVFIVYFLPSSYSIHPINKERGILIITMSMLCQVSDIFFISFLSHGIGYISKTATRYYVTSKQLTESSCNLHFTSTLIVMSHKSNICSVFALQMCLHAAHVSMSLLACSAERKGCKHGTSTAFRWHHYNSAGEIKLAANFCRTSTLVVTSWESNISHPLCSSDCVCMDSHVHTPHT